MSKHLFYIGLILMMLSQSNSMRSQTMKRGDIFSDNFENNSTAQWLDMKAWGFGVWQVKDGELISIDPDNVDSKINSILPKFENAVVNRDYSVLFRFKPVNGKTFTFTIDFRHHGVNNYKVEISKDGKISILKNIVNRLPESLFKTASGQIVFDKWQWLRLDVKGERPLSIKVKVWQGTLKDEPIFYNGAILDTQPLLPQNINFALTMFQEGGAHTIIDNFNIYSKIPVSPLWQWMDEKFPKRSLLVETKRDFVRGNLFRAEIILKALLKDFYLPSILNNLAVVYAERDAFEEALEIIDRAHQLSSDNKTILHNSKWLWYGLNKNGLVQPDSEASIPFIAVSLDKKVYKEPVEAVVNLSLFHAIFEKSRDDVPLQISVQDRSGKERWAKSRKVSAFDKVGLTIRDRIHLSKWEDGNYRIVVRTSNDNRDKYQVQTEFEIIHNRYQPLLSKLKSIQRQVDSLKIAMADTECLNDLANIEVALVKPRQFLDDCESPGRFAFYQEQIETLLSQADIFLQSLKRKEKPFHHQIGTFMRGYYSEIDGSLQGYALHVPDKYSENKAYPLVINLHGYDPSFSSWQENIFLPIFMPHATAHGRYIVVNPFGRGNTMYQNIGENDVLAVLAEVQRLYNIDVNRIYLTGGSMGGAGTWNIGLAYPDKFAALAPIMGPTEFNFWNGPADGKILPVRKFINEQRSALSYAENSLHLPIFCNHGVQDDIVPIEQSRKMVKRLRELRYNIKYVEHPDAQHGGFKPEMDQGIYDWFENLERNPDPKKVVLKSGDLKHCRSYWVKIERFVNLLQFAKVTAEIVSANTIRVETDNVARFSLFLTDKLVDIEQPITVIINDQKEFQIALKRNQRLVFSAKLTDDGKIADWQEGNLWHDRKLIKKTGLMGPIVDAFNTGFVLVYGSKGTAEENLVTKREAEAFSAQWRSWQHVPCRIMKDTKISDNEIEKYNLILFGDANCNLIVRKIDEFLPLCFKENSIVAGDKEFKGDDVGLAMIYPNPLNENRYVVIFAGITSRATIGITRRIGTEFDYVVFDARTIGINILQGNLMVDGTPLLYGFFDQDWQLCQKYQWSGNSEIRGMIKPRKLFSSKEADQGKNSVYLSDVQPDSLWQWNGYPERDRTFWGRQFQINDNKYEKGISLFPNSTIIYQLEGRWDTLSVIWSADLSPYSGLSPERYDHGKIQLGIYGDGYELFVSRAIDVNSPPQEISVPISGVRELKLVVRTQDWLPYFAQCANLIDAKLLKE